MLKVNHVQKSYSHFHLDCSLEIKRGSITGIIGKNGSGKTTLFKAILNLIHIDSGDIILLDKDYKEVDKNKIGCTLANISLCEYLKLKDLVDVLRNTYQDFDLDYFLQKCNQYQFPLDKKINEFSTGMKAKLNVLIALSHHATFLILDEPTNGLDVLAREEIIDLIREFMKEDENRSVLISSHISSDLEGLCDDIYMIDGGKFLFHETTDCLLDQYGLLKLTDKQFDQVNHVQKSYSHFHLDCSLEIKRGSITGIIGKNGSGKTTLFKAILNLIHIDSGDIILLDKDYKEVDKNKIGCTLANISLCEYLKLKDLVDVLRNTYQDFDLDYFLQKCNQYQFPLDKKINEFSTGMKAKLNVLIALSHHATFLILDEPTNGLDVLAREEIIDLIREFMKEDENRSVLISSHISSDLEGLCDDIYMIDGGKFLFHETTDCLLDQYGLLKLTDKQFDQVDPSYFIKTRKENYGYAALTNQKQFYQENYPEIIIEKNNFDTLFSMMLRGE